MNLALTGAGGGSGRRGLIERLTQYNTGTNNGLPFFVPVLFRASLNASVANGPAIGRAQQGPRISLNVAICVT